MQRDSHIFLLRFFFEFLWLKLILQHCCVFLKLEEHKRVYQTKRRIRLKSKRLALWCPKMLHAFWYYCSLFDNTLPKYLKNIQLFCLWTILQFWVGKVLYHQDIVWSYKPHTLFPFFTIDHFLTLQHTLLE